MNNNKVKMSMFKWIIGVVIMLIVSLSGWVVTAIDRVDTKATQNTASISEVSGDIKAIKTDLRWFKQEINNDPQGLRDRFNQLSENQ